MNSTQHMWMGYLFVLVCAGLMTLSAVDWVKFLLMLPVSFGFAYVGAEAMLTSRYLSMLE